MSFIEIIYEEKSIHLEFKNFSCLTFDNNVYWVSLLPDNCDVLHTLHRLIVNTIKLPIKKYFDPHMTLINTKNKNYEKEVEKLSHSYIPVIDTFALSLGKSDEIGQFTEIVYRLSFD